MVGSTTLGLFILEAMGSVVVETGFTALSNKGKLIIISFKIRRAFNKEIESIKNDRTHPHSEDTRIELNRLKANIYSFRPVIRDYSRLNNLPLDERKNEIVKILTTELKKNYDIPNPTLENLVIKFVNISYEMYNKFVVSSEKEYRKEDYPRQLRMENKINEIYSRNLKNSSIITEYHCPLAKQITHLISDNKKLKEENISLKLQPYVIYFEKAVQAETENNYNEAILQFENLLDKIKEDRKKYQEDDYWEELSLKMMEYECFAYLNLSKYYVLSQEYLKSYDYHNKSLFVAERIKTSDNFLAGVYTNYANILVELEKNDEAETYYTRAISLNPKNPVIYNNYVILLKALGRYEEAENIYKLLFITNPEYPAAHYNYANYLALSSKSDEAEFHYKEAIRLKPDYFEAYNNYGNYLAAHERYEEAEEEFRKAIEINPEYPDAQNNYGVLLKRNGNRERAEICFNEAIKLNPNYSQVYANYAILLTEQGRFYEAEKNYLKVIELNPNFFWAYVLYADLLVHLNRISEADLYYKKAFDLYPNIPEIYLLYVTFLLETKKDKNSAYEIYSEALKICPDVSNFLNPFLKDKL